MTKEKEKRTTRGAKSITKVSKSESGNGQRTAPLNRLLIQGREASISSGIRPLSIRSLDERPGEDS
jgi:hypothetical protein